MGMRGVAIGNPVSLDYCTYFYIPINYEDLHALARFIIYALPTPISPHCP